MDLRDLMNKLDNINNPILSEALTLSAVIAATSGYEQDDKVRIPMLGKLAATNGLVGLVDPVTGHYVSAEGDEEDEVPFEIAQKLAPMGLLPKNARLEQAGWFDDNDVFNKANADLVSHSSQVSGAADDLNDKLKKLRELFDKYLQLKSKRAATQVANTSLGGTNAAAATQAAITPQLANVHESMQFADQLIESFGYQSENFMGKALAKAIPGAGLTLGVQDASDRWQKGDYLGAALSGASGVASMAGPVGGAIGLGLDAINGARDYFGGSDGSAPKQADSHKLIPLQKLIGAKPDGIFGPETKQKLMAWQSANGLKADGIPGPQTYAKAGLAEGIEMKEMSIAESIAALRAKLELIESEHRIENDDEHREDDVDVDEGLGDIIGKGIQGAKNFYKGMKTGVNPVTARTNTSTNPNVNLGRDASKAGAAGAWTHQNRGKVAGATGAALGGLAGYEYGKHSNDGVDPKPTPTPKPHPHHPTNNVVTPQVTPTPAPVAPGGDAGDKELADLKAQITALMTDISKSATNNPDAQKTVTDISTRMSSLG